MQIASSAEQPLLYELDLMQQLLPLQGASVLELGCGAAEKIRKLAACSGLARAVAAEVDELAHAKNQQNAAAGIEFARFGAEAIPHADESFDVVLMLKSLHHVPGHALDTAFAEIHRVLKKGGILYISEPVFAGKLNEVIRLFHDEQQVRQDAFEATQRAVSSGQFKLQQQHFFLTEVKLKSFAQFKAGIIDATHSEHHLDDALLQRVRRQFEACKPAAASTYDFATPNRVDLLQVAK